MMPRARRWILSVAAACAAVACGDLELTGPKSPTTSSMRPSFSSSPTAGAGDVVQLLRRSSGLTRDLSVSKIIGPNGGQLQLPAAGIYVRFPAGAVSTPTRITLTAVAGENVAYEFQPHGLTFAAPVIVRQNLKHTDAANDDALASMLQGSYYDQNLARLFVDPAKRFARIKESRPARHNKSARWMEFSIEHFSGYVVSTGKVSVEVEVELGIP